MSQPTLSQLQTVYLDPHTDALVILDQTQLPLRTVYQSLTDQNDIRQAIYRLQVRGAPAIGVAAAIGIYLAAKGFQADTYDAFYRQFRAAKANLASARPTAVNLQWALDRMERVVQVHAACPLPSIISALKQEALRIQQEDADVCRSIGENGLSLLHDGDGILTHCNAGQLAATRYGTALAPIHLGHERGYRFHVYADETRPLLQGARLTAYELQANGIPVTLLCDNMASQVMKNGWVQAVLVGCDRVAANGDCCNKIGTSGVAILARHYGIPFYVCAPTSTIDFSLSHGNQIPIEQRPPEEVTSLWYQHPMVPQGIDVYNPAFDVTEHDLISAIITEYGVARPPYTQSLAQLAEARPRR